MPRHNTASSYGSITKSFHWLTVLLILTIIPVGWFAVDAADEIRADDAAREALVWRAAFLFSLHKTLGVTIFFVALARILWALTQRKPGLINGDRPLEAWAAETVHWLLYGTLVAVPLSGWISHAAADGYAPIWWPFGQNLPFVPKSAALVDTAETVHYILQWVLIGAIAAHIIGALKHHIIDKDATLRRMSPGHAIGHPTERQPGHFLSFVSAGAIWAAAFGGAVMLGWFAERPAPATAQLEAVESGWTVQEGTLGIAVQQMGSEVTGRFANWTAEINYEPADAPGVHGDVKVTIAIGSLTLGTVTQEAMGAQYLNAENHPTAVFEAELEQTGDNHIAKGTLTIRDQTVPVEMPFDLTIDGDTATASGELTLDRREYQIGMETKNEETLGFDVQARFELTATRR